DFAHEVRALALADARREARFFVIRGEVRDALRQARQWDLAAQVGVVDADLAVAVRGTRDDAEAIQLSHQQVERHRDRGLDTLQRTALAVVRLLELADRRGGTGSAGEAREVVVDGLVEDVRLQVLVETGERNIALVAEVLLVRNVVRIGAPWIQL